MITEATNISPQAVGYAMTPGIWSEEQVQAWRPVVEAVHARGGHFVLQLWHTGRISHPDLHGGERPVAPSAIRPEGQAFTKDGMQDHVEPRALETDEIPAIVQDYRRAAENAKAAGFDGVEIHSANNYLLEQFLRDSTNHRDDQYGGSVENRLRFPLAVADAVVGVWGGGRVGIRLSPATTQPARPSWTPRQCRPTARISTACRSWGSPTRTSSRASPTRRANHRTRSTSPSCGDAVPGAYIGNNELTVDDAAGSLERGEADLISFARAYIANPDLVQRIRTGAPLAEAPKEYWYGGDETGYSDWPAMASQAA